MKKKIRAEGQQHLKGQGGPRPGVVSWGLIFEQLQMSVYVSPYPLQRPPPTPAGVMAVEASNVLGQLPKPGEWQGCLGAGERIGVVRVPVAKGSRTTLGHDSTIPLQV